jgi:hypothetical protein
MESDPCRGECTLQGPTRTLRNQAAEGQKRDINDID